ncbi:MAG TPA: NosD domain-containing protein [Caldilineaceae bacterium]|nr:NosD domain-containing protein [Caldilineaceae bacterium]
MRRMQAGSISASGALFLVLLFLWLLPGRQASAATMSTPVQGPIITDTVWAVVASPYLVTDTIVVEQGVTLTVEPGVTVLFEKDKALNILGTLHARGTVSQPITFTSALTTPQPGDWVGLTFADGSSSAKFDPNGLFLAGNILQYVGVEYAGAATDSYAIDAPETAVYLDHSIIQQNQGGARVGGVGNYITDNNFVNNAGGHKVGGLFNVGEAATIRNNAVLVNTSDSSLTAPAVGLVSYGDHSMIADNLIQNNFRLNSDGVAGLYSAGNHTQIYHNVVRGNGGGGILLSGVDGHAPFSDGARVEDNIITDNQGLGLAIVSLRDLNLEPIIVQRNLILANQQGGIAVYASAKVQIVGNRIAENDQTPASSGIFWQSSNEGEITQNKILSNSLGVVVEGSYPSIRFNDIVGNQVYNLRHDNPFSDQRLDARDNWWGMTDLAAIGNTILDWADEAQRGMVMIEPILQMSSENLPKIYLPFVTTP